MEKCIHCGKNSRGGQTSEYYNNTGIWLPKFQTDIDISLSEEQLKSLCDNCAILADNLLSAYYNCRKAAREFGVAGGLRNRWEFDTRTQMIKFWENDRRWEFNIKKISFASNSFTGVARWIFIGYKNP